MVSGDNESAAQPRECHGGDHAMAARHSGTGVTSTTAPSHTSAAWRGKPSVESRPGRRGLTGGRRRRPWWSGCRRRRATRTTSRAYEKQIAWERR